MRRTVEVQVGRLKGDDILVVDHENGRVDKHSIRRSERSRWIGWVWIGIGNVNKNEDWNRSVVMLGSSYFDLEWVDYEMSEMWYWMASQVEGTKSF